MDPAGPEAAPPPSRVRRNATLGAVAILLPVVAFVGRAAYRGTHTDDAARDPASSAEGVVRQLLKDGERKVVRLALVVDQPADKVWETITDYGHYHEFFGNLDGAVTPTPQPNGATRIAGVAKLGPLAWPFEVGLTAEQTPGKRVLRWDEPSKELAVNRGSWTLTEPAPGKTLLVYSLDLEVQGYPKWAVRYVSLNRLRVTLRAVAAEAARRAAK